MSLKNEVTKLLSDAVRMCDACGEASELGKEIKEFSGRLNQPLRVAVVGIMKAGKSTFMNALIKDKLLYTGNEETTYTVSWFKYAPKPSLTIVFKDNKGKEKAPFTDLEKWTVRTKAKDNLRINDVKYIEIYYPNEVLKTMELIDTPGLNSAFKNDAENTLKFLGISLDKANELDEITLQEASLADAIIYAFTRSAGSTDREILTEFHGNSLTSSTSPINALGVFTRSDIFWEPDSEKLPIEIAKRVTDNTMKNPDMKRLLYTTLPVVAKVVEGLVSLNEQDWQYLEQLTNINQETLGNLLEFLPTFTNQAVKDFKDESVRKYIGAPKDRERITYLLDGYGIFEVVNSLRKGLSHDDLIELLYEKSGIKAVNNLVTNHFGNRSFLIKTQYILLHLRSNCFKLSQTTKNQNQKEICRYILDEIDHIETTEHAFQELKILQNFYNSLLNFENQDEYLEFMQITGENGKNCEAKLGQSSTLSVSELANIAYKKELAWRAKANDIGISRYYEHAANTISRSYGIIHYHLNELSGK